MDMSRAFKLSSEPEPRPLYRVFCEAFKRFSAKEKSSCLTFTFGNEMCETPLPLEKREGGGSIIGALTVTLMTV